MIYLKEDRVSDVKRDLEDSPSDDLRSLDQKSVIDSTLIDVTQNELVIDTLRVAHQKGKGKSDETLKTSSLNAIMANNERSSEPFELANEFKP